VNITLEKTHYLWTSIKALFPFIEFREFIVCSQHKTNNKIVREMRGKPKKTALSAYVQFLKSSTGTSNPKLMLFGVSHDDDHIVILIPFFLVHEASPVL
jgi:hypothetical protein